MSGAMTSSENTPRVGLIGYGTAGRDVAEAILGGQAGSSRLAAVLVRDVARYADVALNDVVFTDSQEAFFACPLDVVVETAGHDAVIRYAETSLAHGCDFMVVSVVAFCDQALFDRVMASAEGHGQRVLVPSAAIAGLDRIAAAAIRAGYCEVALITHGQAGRSTRGRVAVDPNLPGSQYEMPYGLIGPPINYAMACSRYMHQYGEERTRQAMAEIAVATRKWANLNPKAVMHDTPMSFDD